MHNLLTELRHNVESAKVIKLSPELESKLGTDATWARNNSRLVDAAVFTYYSTGQKVAGFIAAPKDISKPLPVIVLNRGGTADFGIVRAGRMLTQIADMAQRGYIIIGSQYTGNSLSEGKDEWGGTDLQSVLDLYPIINGLGNADINRIGMYGESRGGMMTYMAMRQAHWIKAAVTVAGVSDLKRNARERPEMKKVFDNAFGGKDDDMRQRSAKYWANDLIGIPLLLMHGKADKRVSFYDSEDLARQLVEQGNKVKLKKYLTGDHGLTRYRKAWLRNTIDWFDECL